jgi:hypothetical protein
MLRPRDGSRKSLKVSRTHSCPSISVQRPVEKISTKNNQFQNKLHLKYSINKHKNRTFYIENS